MRVSSGDANRRPGSAAATAFATARYHPALTDRLDATPTMTAIHAPADHDLMLRVAPMPADVNSNGDIFGGWVMAQVDIAGGIAASRCARGRVATVAVNSFHFRQPISIGDVVSLYTRIEKTGKTSITVHVEVIAERHPWAPVVVKVTEATLTYVAIDDAGAKRLLSAD